MAVALDAILARIKDVCKRNGLLILSVLSVTIGCLLGFFLRTRRLSQQEISYFQFPGELLMRMLKMLILPLVVSSLMSGLAALDAKTSSRLGIITVTYYLWTTFVAVIVGIVMVSIIHPGGAAQKESTEEGGKPIMSSADALLDLIRNMFPANLVEATFKQYRTKSIPIIKSNKASSESTTRRIIIYGIQDENGSNVQNFALDITPPPEVIYKSEPGTSDGMNVLGIVIFSATMGIMLGRMGNSGVPLVSFCQCLNESVMKIVAVAVWYFPFGIVFLIAGKILEMDDPSAIGKKLGFYAITVVCGLVVHGLFILPMMYFFITKKNPIVFIRGILQALLIALATSSSSATLPITFKCLLENNHVDRRIARFVLPVGATINMDGTALYEAVAAIFIAQVNNYELDFGQIITISITATAASIGAAGIPQAGLVTMVIVLTSVGLPTDDITLIIAVDWALDRFRTMINVLGDALAAGIMAHICRKEFIKDGDELEEGLFALNRKMWNYRHPACTGARRPAVNVRKGTQLARDMGFFKWKILILKN
ncbi:excitatory amino acid transporter 5 isoform X3 [Falco rusticolus]|uniref:excitatory amino acid transporter 5 isoform X3 n=1 Tax=Falco peregrinus TaxID=8954 RepID=UPI000FFB7FFB|nr:excitatory amino acid transporter 5 isoform X3 [Falco peregrinus]XP_027662778.1 excitatory amino acid transporter 5 isoform X3 [Falco cherrug]XP_037260444.1 excitatory amino acid transporter 5 isoform X3 [Falco rusticolus]